MNIKQDGDIKCLGFRGAQWKVKLPSTEESGVQVTAANEIEQEVFITSSPDYDEKLEQAKKDEI